MIKDMILIIFSYLHLSLENVPKTCPLHMSLDFMQKQINQLEIVFVKHCAPNYMLIHTEGAPF